MSRTRFFGGRSELVRTWISRISWPSAITLTLSTSRRRRIVVSARSSSVVPGAVITAPSVDPRNHPGDGNLPHRSRARPQPQDSEHLEEVVVDHAVELAHAALDLV